MREIRLSPPQFALIGVTRGLFGLGVGLLLSGRLRKRRRRIAGSALALIGLLSTIPLSIQLIAKQRRAAVTNGHATTSATTGHESVTAD